VPVGRRLSLPVTVTVTFAGGRRGLHPPGATLAATTRGGVDETRRRDDREQDDRQDGDEQDDDEPPQADGAVAR
jgi:hypothetical protein